jgi:hypothetical protein
MSQNSMPTIYVGLDIAKLNLQLHLAGRFHDLPNTAAGHRRLLKLLAKIPEVQVVCEATGGYEREVVRALQQAALPVSLLNPARVRYFARAQANAPRPIPLMPQSCPPTVRLLPLPYLSGKRNESSLRRTGSRSVQPSPRLFEKN